MISPTDLSHPPAAPHFKRIVNNIQQQMETHYDRLNNNLIRLLQKIKNQNIQHLNDRTEKITIFTQE
jgi:hypothetical protein